MKAVVPRREQVGSMLVELLVATACAGILGAGILSLMSGAGAVGRRALLRSEAAAGARGCVDALVREIRNAGSGLDGAASVATTAGTLPFLATHAHGLTLIVPDGPSAEVEAAADGTLRSGGTLPAIGTRVAAVSSGHGAAPAGRLVARHGRGRSRRVRVAWDRPVETVRAIQPIRVRQFAWPAAGAPGALRRRDGNGPWIPVVDGIVGLSLTSIDATDSVAPSARLLIVCSAEVGRQRASAAAPTTVGGR